MMGNQRGFTIIEVMLFLGVSALLFGIAFSFTQGTIRETSFTDDTNQLTSFLQRQYLTVQNSQATRADNLTSTCNTGDAPRIPGASDTCMVLGKLLYINQANSTINVSTIVGDATFVSQPAELETVRLLQPRVIASGGSSVIVDESFAVPGRLSLSQMSYKLGASASPFNALALIRSPQSDKVYLVTWEVTAASANQVSTYNGPSGIASKLIAPIATNTFVNKPVLICSTEGGTTNRRAAVVIPIGDTVDRITKVVTVQNQSLAAVGMSCTL